MKTGKPVFITLGRGPCGEKAGRGLAKVCSAVLLKAMVEEGRCIRSASLC